MASHVVRVAPLKTAVVSAFVNATTGTTAVVTAPAGAYVRVLSLAIVSTIASTVKFQSSTGATDITATLPLGANGGIVLPFNEHGWFSTLTAGDVLNFVQGTATAIGIQIQYQLMLNIPG